MQIKVQIIFAGLFLGAMSWAVCRIVSNKFEPFDTTSGLLLGQILLCTGAALVGFKHGLGKLLLMVFSIHIGQNIYAFNFGGSEQRTWFILGFFTSVVFLVLPLLVGSIAIFISKSRKAS